VPTSSTPRRPSRRLPVLLASAGLTAGLTIGLLLAFGPRPPSPAQGAPEPLAPVAVLPSVPARAVPEPPPLKLSVMTVRLAPNQTLGQVLNRLKLAPGEAQAILRALADKFPIRRVRPGDQLRLERVEGERGLRSLSFRQSAADEWTVTAGGDGALRAEKRAVALVTERTRVDVAIEGSVWESLQKAGEDPALAVLASDVLAWDVDFYQDVRAGDHLKVVVDKVMVDGKLLRYGEVLAAEYDGAVTGPRRLFRYQDGQGFASYYDEAGNSARRGFLKSPLKYAHLTSRFGSRLHPLLGFVRSHLGVDYGAPVGTPVWAVGDGTVTQAGYNGGCGKSVTLRHRNGFETVYCHLSAIAVHQGARVMQKDVVGLVGQTGLATGPHLHFAVRRDGAFVNPLSLKVPREAPIAPDQRADFETQVAPLRAALDASPRA